MNRWWLLVLLAISQTVSAAQTAPPPNVSCAAAAKRLLGANVRILRSGDLTGRGRPGCVAIVPRRGNQQGDMVLAKRGVILEADATEWRELLRFSDEITNDHGYIGIQYLDPDFHSGGFGVELRDERSDGSKAFTLYLTFVKRNQPEGMPVPVSWNPTVQRFQEYAPNGGDVPEFWPELAQPPVRKLP